MTAHLAVSVASESRAVVRGASAAPLVAVLPDHAAGPATLSFGDFSEVSPGVLPCDPHRFRVLFPDLWRGFCRAHFRDVMRLAYSLGVTERAARSWWEGDSGANGAAALYAVAHVPGAMAWMADAVRRAA